jgi:hypothetical protein
VTRIFRAVPGTHQKEPIVITARGLARTYRTKRSTVEAVRGVDLGVAGEEVVDHARPYGLGAGKRLFDQLDLDDLFLTMTGRSLRDEPAARPAGTRPW